MDDRNELEKVVAVDVAVSPLTYVPVGGGILLMAFGVGLTAFGGVLAIAGGMGFALWRWFRGCRTGHLYERAHVLIQKRQQEHLECELDALEAELRSLGSKRGAGFLNELRSLMKDLQHKDMWAGVEGGSAEELQITVNQLFRDCIEKLRVSVTLKRRRNETSTPAVREALETRRDTVLHEVEKNMKTLGGLVADISTLTSVTQEQAAILRARIEQAANIAKKVNAAMHQHTEELLLTDVAAHDTQSTSEEVPRTPERNHDLN